ncbi:MAG: hypothetical protein WCI04_02185 [archaeon]
MIKFNKNVAEFYKSINSVSDHRYKSWEHCHNFFLKIMGNALTDKDLDLAQLHLAFYLASWGMYRGSSFILQKDYTIFKNTVEIILDKKYALLWNIEKNLTEKSKMIDLFVELYGELDIEFKNIRESVKRHPDVNKSKRYLNKIEKISSTLITKVILGTIGCIPAYDRYFIEGLKLENIQQKFNPNKSFSKMLEIYSANKKEIDTLCNQFAGYVPMKILDMYFWIEGSEILED